MSEVPGSFKQWCHRELSRILDYSVDDDLLDYLLCSEGEKDMREYLRDILGEDTKRAQVFMHEFFRHWKPPSLLSSLSIGQLDIVDKKATVEEVPRSKVLMRMC